MASSIGPSKRELVVCRRQYVERDIRFLPKVEQVWDALNLESTPTSANRGIVNIAVVLPYSATVLLSTADGFGLMMA